MKTFTITWLYMGAHPFIMRNVTVLRISQSYSSLTRAQKLPKKKVTQLMFKSNYHWKSVEACLNHPKPWKMCIGLMRAR